MCFGCPLSFIANYEPSGTWGDGFAGCVLLNFSNRKFLYFVPNRSVSVIKCTRDSIRVYEASVEAVSSVTCHPLLFSHVCP